MSQQFAVDFPRERRLYVALALCIVISLTVFWVHDRGALGCVVCFRPSQQSLLEKVEAGDRVVIARLVDQTQHTWQIVDVMKGGLFNPNRKRQIDEVSLDD